MKKLTFTILFPILFCTITLAQSTWELKNKADSLIQEENFILAAEIYQQITENDKFEVETNPKIYVNLAKSWLLAGEINLAISALDSAFIYGYDDLNDIENDGSLYELRRYPKFQELINREREFFNVEVIDNEWLLKALSIKKVVRLDDSKWNWVFDLEKFNGLEKYENISLEYDLKIAEDSFYDFSSKVLLITNSKSPTIELSKLKLRVLGITSKLSNKNREIDLTEFYRGLSDYSELALSNLNIGTLEMEVSNTNIAEITNITTKSLNILGMAKVERVGFSNVNAENSGIFIVGSENAPSLMVNISNSQFGSTDNNYPNSILIHSNMLSVMNSTFLQATDFGSSKIDNQIMFIDNQFKKEVNITFTNFDVSQNYMPYNQFTEGFSIISNVVDKEGNYNKMLYDQLINVNKRMHSVYRERGDLESANAIYIKLKDLMTEYTLHQYKETGEFEYLIQYQIEKLLKFYTKSGTSPARAILISIYILLGFSIIYLFFPSEWDNQRNKQVIQDYKLLTEKNDAGYLKPFIALSSNAFIVWLNAFSLSLNAFVTLGFGSIPIKGVGKYICIIQGFMGWFLLSIFTVTLINQILI
jgi:hypothetical protein